MSLMHAIDMLETQGAKSAYRFLSKMEYGKTRSLRGLSKDPRVIEVLKLLGSLKHMDHPKQERLKELLLADIEQNPSAKTIVFTQFRDTADMIVDDLKETDKMFPVKFVGQATKSEYDIGLTQMEQAQILEDFRGSKYNVLVTTSIGEEGLHVPDVDHVIFYEAVPSEIRMIQRRGRTGRTKPGKTTIMITEGTIDEAYYWSSKRKEQQMRRHLERLKNHGVQNTPKKETLLDYA
jgi:Fanconi anemia group M protein